MEELGRKLLEERQLRNITLQDISAATHISIGVLKDIENGKFDKYTGDEEYIKKYIKKYADYLGIESDEFIDSYVALTQEISLAKIKEQEEKIKAEPKKPVTTTITKPAFAQSTKVYDNHSGRTFVKYTIIIALCLLIVGSVWYALKLSNKDNTGFDSQNPNHISGTPDVDTTEDPVIPPVEENQKEDPSKVETEKVEMTRTAANQYSIKLPKEAETFTLKIDFVAQTWSSMLVNGKAYNEFQGRLYNSANASNDKNAKPETIELTFNTKDVNTIVLRNGCNLYHRYYFNGEELVTQESDQVNNVADVIFTIIKE